MFKWILIIIGVILLLILVPFAVMFAWGWVVPDVFSGAVERHILPDGLTYVQAIKILVLLAILGLTSRSSGGSKS